MTEHCIENDEGYLRAIVIALLGEEQVAVRPQGRYLRAKNGVAAMGCSIFFDLEEPD